MRKPSGFLGNRREPAGTGDQSPSPSKLIALGVQKVLLPTRTCLTQTGASCCKIFLEGMFPCMSFVFTLSRHGFARRGPLTVLDIWIEIGNWPRHRAPGPWAQNPRPFKTDADAEATQ